MHMFSFGGHCSCVSSDPLKNHSYRISDDGSEPILGENVDSSPASKNKS